MSEHPATTKHPGILRQLSAAEEATLDERGVPKFLGSQYRRTQVTSSGYDKENHTVTMAVSSETPVDRYYGQEILSHAPGAIRTGRLKQGVAMLFNHDEDQHLGRSQKYKVRDDQVLEVTSRFGPSPLAVEKEADVAADILVDVSIRYAVYEWDIVERKNEPPIYTATDWELLEVSLVTVPADPTVGVGRGAGDDATPVKYTFRKLEDPAVEAAVEAAAPAAADEAARALPSPADPAPTPETPTPEPQRTITMEPTATVTVDHAAVEAARVAGLTALRTNYPQHFSETALHTAIALDMPLERAKGAVADAVIAGSQRDAVPTLTEEFFNNLSAKERSAYSLRNIYAAATNMRNPGMISGVDPKGFEVEVSNELRKQAESRGITGLGGGLLVPSASTRSAFGEKRTIASGGNAGTYANFTEVISDPIELLRSRVFIMALGAQFLTGLKGKIQMPRQNAAASSSWLLEGNAVSNSDLTLDDIVMQPNRLSIQNSYYRDFLAQSAVSIDPLLSNDRMQVLARSLNGAAIAGSGTAPVPTGLLNRSGLAAVLSGTTRAANGTVTAGLGGVPLTYVDVNAMESTISTANGDIGTMRWLGTPKVRAASRSIPKTPGTSQDFIMPDSKVGANGLQTAFLGYDGIFTSDANLTGFTANSVAGCHALILGVWDQMLIGDWGLSEIVVDNVTGAASAKVIITEHAFYDTNVRHLASFCANTSILPS
jgi:HK97 family phage major capsid protein/HK97 family phage prohead protease